MAVVTPRSVRLGRQLARLRAERQMTAADAAAQIHGKTQPWLSRIEGGETKINLHDLALLLKVYGLRSDDQQYKELTALATNLEEPQWWELASLRRRYLEYVGFEAEATHLRNWEPNLIPGLLQIPEYASGILNLGEEERDGAIEERLRARLSRQVILSRETPVTLHAIIGEAALRCKVGGSVIHFDQLRHLYEQARLPNVTIQVVPYEAGAYIAAWQAFVLLYFGQGDPPLSYMEHITRNFFIEGAPEIKRLERVFDDLTQHALTPEQSIEWIKRILEES